MKFSIVLFALFLCVSSSIYITVANIENNLHQPNAKTAVTQPDLKVNISQPVVLKLSKFSPWNIFAAGDVGNLNTSKQSNEYLNLFVAETQWYNDVILFWMPKRLRRSIPHVLQGWMRNYVAGTFVYFATAGVWSLYVYKVRGSDFYAPGAIPTSEAIMKQIKVSMKSMPLYVSLPSVSEFMVENGWTKCFSSVQEVGFGTYILYFGLYMFLVEFGIYWMHRELHEIKFLYKWLHATHHVYNKQNTLSPFASLAFHPLDGILQASPHVIALFLVPIHFTTHVVMLFMEAIWATNIHDNVDENLFPLMGAGYHTIHHTTYRHNYGHYTVLFDWLFGTLKDPKLDKES